MKLSKDIPRESTFVYREQPPSGNITNGWGEKTKRRARYVFHSNPKTGPLPWDKLNQMFLYCYPVWGFPLFIANRFAAFAFQGKLAEPKRPVEDEAAMAEQVRQAARDAGAALVGICELEDGGCIVSVSLRRVHRDPDGSGADGRRSQRSRGARGHTRLQALRQSRSCADALHPIARMGRARLSDVSFE